MSFIKKKTTMSDKEIFLTTIKKSAYLNKFEKVLLSKVLPYIIAGININAKGT